LACALKKGAQHKDSFRVVARVVTSMVWILSQDSVALNPCDEFSVL
jgi:hypothetical protein